MSTSRKGLNDGAVIDDASRLSIHDLFMECEGHMRRGKRSLQMVQALKVSLQLFHENQLGAALRARPKGMDLEQMCELLSLEIANLGVSPQSVKYCDERGLKYVGEFVSICWEKRFAGRQEAVVKAITRLGLETSLDVVALGWRPPYWDDPAIRLEWDKSVVDALTAKDFDRDDCHHCSRTVSRFREQHFAGTLFTPGRKIGYAQGLQALLRTSGSSLHGGMIADPGWQAPGLVSESTIVRLRELVQRSSVREVQVDALISLAEFFNDEQRELLLAMACEDLWEFLSADGNILRERVPHSRAWLGTWRDLWDVLHIELARFGFFRGMARSRYEELIRAAR